LNQPVTTEAHHAENAAPPPQAEEEFSALASPSVQLTQVLAITSLVALIALCLLWELWLAPLRPGGSWLCLKALPLCIPLTGLLKKRLYTYRWMSLWIWLYFTEGVVRCWGDTYPSNLLAAGELLLCLALFASCALHVRSRFQNAIPKQPLN
jgi:uncharacterized membrane protein